jgi:hypothetical protein
MKTTIKFAIIAAIALLAFAALNGTGCKPSSMPSTASENATSQTRQYTCPMHPEVVSDKPGKCPKCGMDLVEKH